MAGSGALMGGGFWSHAAFILVEKYGIAWMQRGLSIISLGLFAAICVLTRYHSRREPAADCAENDMLGTSGIVHSRILDASSLVAIFCLFMGSSSFIIFFTSFAVDHGLSTTHLGYVQDGFFKAAVFGHLILSTIEKTKLE